MKKLIPTGSTLKIARQGNNKRGEGQIRGEVGHWTLYVQCAHDQLIHKGFLVRALYHNSREKSRNQIVTISRVFPQHIENIKQVKNMINKIKNRFNFNNFSIIFCLAVR